MFKGGYDLVNFKYPQNIFQSQRSDKHIKPLSAQDLTSDMTKDWQQVVNIIGFFMIKHIVSSNILSCLIVKNYWISSNTGYDFKYLHYKYHTSSTAQGGSRRWRKFQK